MHRGERRMNEDAKSKAEPDDDVVWGAGPIGKVINRSPVQTNYLLVRGLLPAKKIGNLWVARRSRLLAVFDAEVA
jgi:hypothetical protein